MFSWILGQGPSYFGGFSSILEQGPGSFGVFSLILGQGPGSFGGFSSIVEQGPGSFGGFSWISVPVQHYPNRFLGFRAMSRSMWWFLHHFVICANVVLF